MKRVGFCLAIVAIALAGPQRKKKAPQAADLEVVSLTAHRVPGKVAVDGAVKNTSGKVIRGLVLVFDFMADGRAVITTQKGALDDEALDPGEEAGFRVELVDPVRAVAVAVQAVDRQERDLRVAKSGPFPIE